MPEAFASGWRRRRCASGCRSRSAPAASEPGSGAGAPDAGGRRRPPGPGRPARGTSTAGASRTPPASTTRGSRSCAGTQFVYEGRREPRRRPARAPRPLHGHRPHEGHRRREDPRHLGPRRQRRHPPRGRARLHGPGRRRQRLELRRVPRGVRARAVPRRAGHLDRRARGRAGRHRHAGEPAARTSSYLQGWAPKIDFADRAKVVGTGGRTCVPRALLRRRPADRRVEPRPSRARTSRKFYARGVGNIRVGAAGGDEQEVLVLARVKRLRPGALARVRRQALVLERRAYRVHPDLYGPPRGPGARRGPR